MISDALDFVSGDRGVDGSVVDMRSKSGRVVQVKCDLPMPAEAFYALAVRLLNGIGRIDIATAIRMALRSMLSGDGAQSSGQAL